MKNYYDILGIKPEATSVEIKKAYFKMVRKYPPDKFEEEFKEIRAAYELLSNEVTKKEYDLMFKLPPYLRQGFENAKECIRDGEIRYAIKILEEIRTHEPDIVFIKAVLADAYILNGNSGKAIRFYEELVNENSDNASFRGKLAEAYLERGWQKKAISAYEIAIKLDKDNVSLLIGLSDAYINDGQIGYAIEVLTRGTLQTEDVDLKMTIYMRLISYNLYIKKIKNLEVVLEDVYKLAVEQDKEEKETIALVFKYVSESLIDIAYIKEAGTWIKKAIMLSPNDKEIKALSNVISNSGEAFREFKELEDDDRIERSIIDAIGYQLFKDRYEDTNKEDQKQMRHLMDCGIALEYGPKIRKTIRIIKEEYPNIYSFRKEFFQSLEDSKKRKAMVSYIDKNKHMIFNKFNFFHDMYSNEEDDDFYFNGPFQEPIHREEPKIGRNDPCPCGSGKKYKKCCG